MYFLGLGLIAGVLVYILGRMIVKDLFQIWARRRSGWWNDICTCAHICSDHYESVGGCMKCQCPRFSHANPASTP